MVDLRTIRAGWAYAQSLLHYGVDGLPRPFSAAFNVTDRCNLSCEYCNFSSFAGPELTIDEIVILYERLWTMGIRRLGLVGGEPMMRRDIADIVLRARQRGFYVSINTNLTLYHLRPGALGPADLVFTSLDGDRSAHEGNRGAGSYEGVIDAIRDLVAHGTSVVAICVVRDGDLAQARALLAQARGLGIRMHFQPQCLDTPIARGALPETATQQLLQQFWLQLAAIKAEGERTLASSLPYLRAQASWPDYRIPTQMDSSQRCAAGRGFIFVDPRGYASPCTYLRGRTAAIDLLRYDWAYSWHGETPCTRCNVGPMLEFNLLYRHPLRASLNAIRGYA